VLGSLNQLNDGQQGGVLVARPDCIPGLPGPEGKIGVGQRIGPSDPPILGVSGEDRDEGLLPDGLSLRSAGVAGAIAERQHTCGGRVD
jgi:hypothetical protein